MNRAGPGRTGPGLRHLPLVGQGAEGDAFKLDGNWTSGPGPGETLADPDWRNIQLMASSGESTWDDHQDHQSSRAAAKATSSSPWVVRVM